MKFSLEKLMRVYDDENGCFYQVEHDPDGLGCVSIAYQDSDDDKLVRIATIPPEMARLLAKAITEVADDMQRSL